MQRYCIEGKSNSYKNEKESYKQNSPRYNTYATAKKYDVLWQDGTFGKYDMYDDLPEKQSRLRPVGVCIQPASEREDGKSKWIWFEQGVEFSIITTKFVGTSVLKDSGEKNTKLLVELDNLSLEPYTFRSAKIASEMWQNSYLPSIEELEDMVENGLFAIDMYYIDNKNHFCSGNLASAMLDLFGYDKFDTVIYMASSSELDEASVYICRIDYRDPYECLRTSRNKAWDGEDWHEETDTDYYCFILPYCFYL